MMQTSSILSPILLPIFCGQGTLFFNPGEASKCFRQLTSSPTVAMLLDACFDAFQAELQTLSAEAIEKVGIYINDFKDKGSLLCPIREEYLSNPIISGSTLLLLQVSRFLRHVEGSAACPRPLDSLLLSNARHEIGVLGYSSGVIAATVVAASRTKFDLLRHAVEAYRLAFWIGVRSQLSHISNSSGNSRDIRPWALVVFSPDLSTIKQALQSFNEASERVFITSVIDDHVLTISGHPDDLAEFKLSLPNGTQICETNIGCLYHIPSKLDSVREEVLRDVASRGIRFPTYQDLFVPVRSSFDGGILKATQDGQSLVQAIVDMVLLQPVNWEMAVNSTVASIPCNVEVELLNVGMSKTLLKGLENSLSRRGISNFHYCDLRNEDHPDTSSSSQVPIAIIGMSVRTPGAESSADLWNLLTKGLNTLEVIPADRFDFSYYCNGEKPGRRMTANSGNFVHSLGEFDNKFFNISPREAKSLDPQQTMLLHVAYEALENAGYVPDSTPAFAVDSFGCFIGAADYDYLHNLRNDIDLYYSTGTMGAFLSGRLSYCLGFSGPSMVVDTACSASLVAIHQAARALAHGDCKAALAGGVNVICSPDMFVGLDNAHFLSPTGGCKSFDASADGYSRSDGCGIFVLKRLTDAIEENDRILGIIRGVEVNQSGKARSITHPHAPTLEHLFTRLLNRSGIKAHSVNYIEAHAPGTQAGDINELSSLRRVLATDRPANNPLYIGSLKANIGHLEAASGAASLAKVLLMLSHKVIPAQISLKTLNPAITPFDVDNVRISTTNLSWDPSKMGARRLALVNNFGASGSNAAMVVEEYISTPTQRPCISISTHIFGLSAKDDSSLGQLRINLIKWLEFNREVSLTDLSYTLMARRQVYPYRLVVTAGTVEELIDRLNDAITVHVPQNTNFPVVFVFSGQGVHYPGMGSSLYQSSPLFKKCIDECDTILRGLGFPSILPIITGDGEDASSEEATQTAVFALEYALAMVWMSWGITPIALVGHSLGEYAALVIGETLQLRDALIIIATRARLLFERCTGKATGMLAVALAPVTLESVLDSPRWTGLRISCYNSPQACVVAGPLSNLTEFKQFLESEHSFKCTLLDVPFAFHSSIMAAVHDELLTLGGDVKTRPSSIPIVSTVFGRVFLPGDVSLCSEDYFAKHCSDPVRFKDAIEAYLSCSTLGGANTVWLEIGPHSSLLPMLQSFHSLEQSTFVASLHKKQDGWATMSKALASFYLTHTVDWRSVFTQIGPASLLSLPSYPFSRNKYWVPFKEAAAEFGTPKLEFTLIRNWRQIQDGRVAIFETSTTRLKPYIEGHRVGGVPLCPASIYLELAAAGMTLALSQLSTTSPRNSGLLFEHISFLEPFVLRNIEIEDGKSVRLIVDTTSQTFSINTEVNTVSHEDTTKHAEGNCQLVELSKVRGEFEGLLPSVDLLADKLINSTDNQHLKTFSTRTAYDLFSARLVDYSEDFHTIRSLTISPDNMEAAAKVCFDKGSQSGHFVVHPLFLDTLIHIAGFVANFLENRVHINLCVGIGCISLLPDTIDKSVDYTIYVKGTVIPNGVICESYAIRNGSSRALVASAKEIRFQRVNLKSLTTSLASLVHTTSPDPLESRNSPTSPCINQSTVASIVAKNCNISVDDISPEDELDSLGIDSLMRLALRYDLTTTFPDIRLSPYDISSCRYVQELVDLTLKSRTPVTSSVALTPSQATVVPSLDLAPQAQVENLITDYDKLDSFRRDSLPSVEIAREPAPQDKTHLSTNPLDSRQALSDSRTCLLNGQLPSDALVPQVGAESSSIPKLYYELGLDKKLWALLTSTSLRPPLVLVHPGGGLAVAYSDISNLDRTVYGINNPHFLTSQPWSSLTQMAESYASIIQDELDEPVIIGGWSFGGVVAFEVAKVLQSRSCFVKGVVLVDSPTPLVHDLIPQDLFDGVINPYPQIQQLHVLQCKMNNQLLAEYHPHDVKLSGTIPIVFLRSKEGSNISRTPTWIADRSCAHCLISGWTVLSGCKVRMIDIPGTHFTPFEPPNVEETSRCIEEACEILERNTLIRSTQDAPSGDGVDCESYAICNGSSPRASLVAVAEDPSESNSFPATLLISQSTIINILARNYNVSVDDISPAHELDSLGIDSLMRSALQHDLTTTFPDIRLSLHDISACRYIQELVDLVLKSLTPTTSSGALTPRQVTVVSSSDLAAPAHFLHNEEQSDEPDSGHDSLSSAGATREPATITQYKTHSDTDSPAILSPADVVSQAAASNTLENKLHLALGLDKKLWALQTSNSSQTSLVLVHPGSGIAVSYSHISNLDRTVYGINNPRFLTSQPWSSLTQMAESYANLVQDELDEPVIIGGWSFGGVVAFEVAKFLQARSCLVKGVILVDAPTPLVHDLIPQHIFDVVIATRHNPYPQIQQLRMFQRKMNNHLLAEYNPHDVKLLGTIPIVYLRSKEGFNSPDMPDIPTWISDRSCAHSFTSGWTDLSGCPVRMIDIPGNHFTPFDPCNVEETSKCIGKACEILEGNDLIQTAVSEDLPGSVVV